MSEENENYGNKLAFSSVKTLINQTMANTILALTANNNEGLNAHIDELCYVSAYLGRLLDDFTPGSTEYNRVLKNLVAVSNTVFMLEDLKTKEGTQ